MRELEQRSEEQVAGQRASVYRKSLDPEGPILGGRKPKNEGMTLFPALKVPLTRAEPDFDASKAPP